MSVRVNVVAVFIRVRPLLRACGLLVVLGNLVRIIRNR